MMNDVSGNTVGLVSISAEYPSTQPYHPSSRYPEYPFEDVNEREQNRVYDGVRQLLFSLALDVAHYGTREWNPLGSLIKPGERVLVKPNMVKESHLGRPNDFDYVITHGAVIRAICDYALIALGGRGEILLADAPETDADFDLVCRRNGVAEMLNFYSKRTGEVSVRVLDLRKERWRKQDGVIVDRWPLPGDPEGYTVVALNERSEFVGHGEHRDYFGATFDTSETQRHHHGLVHEYLISSSVLRADVVITVPKLKTHKKSGMTCCLKNLVGIIGDKNWLPHHTEGTVTQGGDQFPQNSAKAQLEYRLFGRLKAAAARSRAMARILGATKKLGRAYFGSTEEVIRSGNWYGNDTVWRMILDLNKILFYFDEKARMLPARRRVFCLVDAVRAGEGIGPLHPDSKPLGLLLAGADPAVVDRCCTRIMGFDYRKIPAVVRAFRIQHLPLTQAEHDVIQVVSPEGRLCGPLEQIRFDPSWAFMPHFGWKGHIELEPNGR